jgi:hypothetical protein
MLRSFAEFTLSKMPGSFAEFTLSRMPGSFASLRMTSEGLRMTSEGLRITSAKRVLQHPARSSAGGLSGK